MYIRKKKWTLTLYCVLVGTVIAFMTSATLGAWGIFALSMIGAFGAADVTDKKLNGGTYDTQPPSDNPRRGDS